MEKFLANLRKKPRAYRQSVALGVSAGVSALIFFGWLASFAIGANPILNSPDGAASENVASPQSPFSVFKEQFSQLTADFSAKFSGKAATSSLSYDQVATGSVSVYSAPAEDTSVSSDSSDSSTY